MRDFPSFSCFLIFFAVSAANSQQSEWNSLNIKTEIMKMNAKFSYLSDEIDELKNVVNKSKDEINSLKKELLELKRRDVALEKSVSLTKHHIYSRFYDEYNKKMPDFTWTIDNIKSKVKQTNFTLLSEVFPLKGYSFGAQAKLTLDKNSYLQIHLSYKDVNQSGNALNLTLIPSQYFTFKDQPSNNVFRQANYVFGWVMQYDVFYSGNWLIASNNIANDTIAIEIRVEAPEVAQQGYSHDGFLAWTVKDFRLKREMESKWLFWYQASPPFFVSSQGYRVRVFTRLNGRQEFLGIGLTVEIDFLTGHYDANLSKSFKHKTTVAIFHPTDATKHVIKSVDKDLKDGSWYMIDMGTHDEIDQLLDGDTLYYHVKIIPA